MKYKIREIAPMSSQTVNPQNEPNTVWHLYSLPSFDVGKREEVKGSEIKSNKFIVPSRCILYNKLNVRFKRVWRVNSNEDHLIASTEFLPLVPNEDIVDYNYLYYFLISDKLTNFFDNQNSNTSGSHKRIDIDNFLNMEIDLPSIDIQKKIGRFISINDKLALNTRMNAELEAMAKQLYDYWFVQFDFPDENGNPYKSSGGEMVYNATLKREIPAGWEVKPLNDLLLLEDSRRIPLSNKERENRRGIYPYYGATGIMDYIDDYIFDGDYILLAEDGSTSDKNGNPVVQYIWGKNWVNNHAHIIHASDDSQLQFYYFLLKTIPVVLIETGSIQKKISQENLLAYSVACPPNRLVGDYCSISSSFREKQKELTDENNYLTHIRDSLLLMLMNGQVTVE
jgi:type I restriction enzyme S subunit